MALNLDFFKGFSFTQNKAKIIDFRNLDDINLNSEEARKKYVDSFKGNLFQDRIQIKWENEKDWWEFPLDPVISISCKNIIVRRNVFKLSNTEESRRGSIKEVWSQDDYEINIAGVLMGENGELPEKDLNRLRSYCEAKKTIEVESKLFTVFNITKLAIENYSFPFTKGMENQAFTIKAYSDDMFDLLVKEEKI